MVKFVNVPVEWREHLHPRRGGTAGPRAVLAEDAAREARRREREAGPIAAEMAAHERTAPEFAAAVRARLRGEPDPLGAAAVAAVAMKFLGGASGAGCAGDAGGAAFLDAWALDHGLAFAACAVTEMSSLTLGPVPEPAVRNTWGTTTVGHAVFYSAPLPPGWRGEIRRPVPGEYSLNNGWIAEDAVAKRLRALLAAAPEDEYRDAVTRLAAHRGDAQRRSLASYLVPTERAWADEVLDDASGPLVLGQEHLLASLSRAAHAAHANRIGWIPVTPAVLGTLLDGLGSDALPLLGRTLRQHLGDAEETRPLLLRALLEIPDEAIFPVLLDLVREKGVPAAMAEATGRYPEQAVRALAPLAGEDTARGLQAAGLLRGLLYTDPGLAAALPAGAAAPPPRAAVPDAAALPAALAGPPARTAKVAWADPALLPRILTRDRARALPEKATARLLNLLADKAPEAADVRAFCDRHSLAEFSWAVFERWHALGSPARHNWALAQLGLIGDDTTVRRLVPLIRRWPGEGGTARAAAALDVLAAIGSDVALTHLFELTRGGRFKGLRARADRKIDEIAAARGLTRDALADRAVPAFGLDGEGALVLDYGPRRFTVTFDERLVPLVREANGRIRTSAPRPGPKDDPALAPAAHALFTGLRKDLRTIAAQEIGRLETAMITRRGWAAGDFGALLAAHPLLRHIVRRLVWRTGDGLAFRVAEDGTYADVADDSAVLAPDARVTVAHPLLLGDDLAAWAELFADYEILQPFHQLARPVHRLTGDERAAHRLARVEGLVLPYGKAKGHSRGRWESRTADGEFAGEWLARRDPAGLYVVANLAPGLAHYMYGEGADQKITAFWAGPAPAEAPENTVPLGAVDPVTMSEAVHDLVRGAS